MGTQKIGLPCPACELGTVVAPASAASQSLRKAILRNSFDPVRSGARATRTGAEHFVGKKG